VQGLLVRLHRGLADRVFVVPRHSSRRLLTGLLELLAVLTLSLPALALSLGALERRFGARDRRRRTRTDTVLDVSLWFGVPLLTEALTRVIGVADHVRPSSLSALIRAQPLWLQGLEALLLADLAGYLSHRVFHGRLLWRFHALHHTTGRVDWLTSARFHPLNDVVSSWFRLVVLAFAGFELHRFAPLLPVVWLHLVVIHADLPTRWGPLRWLLVSPLYHRVHHTHGGDPKNLASIFPFIDWMFGTAHMPPAAGETRPRAAQCTASSWSSS
jgi:sterol desaturase/sphingolipid hydroxylase (fatty acid hydroxylase superfamily)